MLRGKGKDRLDPALDFAEGSERFRSRAPVRAQAEEQASLNKTGLNEAQNSLQVVERS